MPSAPSTHPDIPPFPAPTTFSILPDIYLLIARLNTLQTPAAPTGSQQQQQQPAPAPSSQAVAGTLLPPPLPSSSQPTRHIQPGDAPPLDVKDLPAHVYPIKQKLGKARAAVSALPDVARTVAEQEAEIRELQTKVALLRARLGMLGGIAAAARGGAASGKGEGRPDAVMEGVEG